MPRGLMCTQQMGQYLIHTWASAFGPQAARSIRGEHDIQTQTIEVTELPTAGPTPALQMHSHATSLLRNAFTRQGTPFSEAIFRAGKARFTR